MKTFLRFLVLVVALNLVRYVAGIPIEYPLVTNKMFGVMERNASCFNINFSTLDWATLTSTIL